MTVALCGGLGGISYCLGTYPADVVKSRIQVDSNSELAKKSFFSALKHIYQKEGT
jgi:hypothetical protein